MPPINPRVIKGITPSLQWLSDLLAFFQVETIRIPAKYREKVIAVKRLLNDDPSGIASSILDFAISAALVDYQIETENAQLTKVLNNWLENINSSLRGSVPTGVDALAKEYFRERWKGSSNLLLRTFWEEVDGMYLPTTMFFVDGEDIKVSSSSNDGVLRLGDEKYYIKVGDPLDYSNKIKPKDIPLPAQENEKIFVQRPFESWGVLEPVPFLIKRGVFRAAKFLDLMNSKGELIVGRALEYLLIMKKGTKELALEGNITYDENDLRKANEDLKDVVARRKVQPGFSSFATNFDTEISEYIPEYKKAIDSAILAPANTKILAGLGMIDVVTSVDVKARRESAMNPKPFVSEVNCGINDFKTLLTDVIKTIVEENAPKHRKWMTSKIKIINSPVKEFIEEDAKSTLRSLYDRGLLSKRTTVEILGDVDFDFEVMRREAEDKDGLTKTLYPPVVQNLQQPGLQEIPGQVGVMPPTPVGDTAKEPSKKKKTLPDRQGPEAKNFTSSEEQEIETSATVEIPESPAIKELREKKLEVLAKQSKLIDKLLKEDK